MARSVCLESLAKAGVNIDPLEYDFVYGYPPLGSLPKLDGPAQLVSRGVPRRVALYVHLPFCSYRCSFCYFVRRVQPKEGFVQGYLETLAHEMRSVAHWGSGTEVGSVYFGGGTPTYLPLNRLLWLIDLLKSLFTLSPGHEWTVETTPETIDADKAKALVSAGVTRISVGVESFSDHRLKALGRGHSAEQAADCVRAILDSGADHHNVDMIYGFPGQDCEGLVEELQAISRLPIHSVTWYQLWQRMNTPMRRRELKKRQMSAEQMLTLKCMIREGMAELGFTRDKVDWFVKRPTDGQQQQDHKWTGGDFLGLGASAYGFVDGFYYRNHPDVGRYKDAVRDSGWGVGQGGVLTQDQLVRRRVMLGIKRSAGVPLKVLQSSSDGARTALRTRIERLVAAGLLATEEQHVRLTAVGQMFGDDVSNALGLAEQDQPVLQAWRRYERLA